MVSRSKFQMTKPILKKFYYTLRDKDKIIKNALSHKISYQIKTNCNRSDNNAVVETQIAFNDDIFPYVIDLFVSTNVIWESDVDSETLEGILNQTIPTHLVSYIRPIITIITSYSPYSPFNLPLLDLSNNLLDDL